MKIRVSSNNISISSKAGVKGYIKILIGFLLFNIVIVILPLSMELGMIILNAESEARKQIKNGISTQATILETDTEKLGTETIDGKKFDCYRALVAYTVNDKEYKQDKISVTEADIEAGKVTVYYLADDPGDIISKYKTQDRTMLYWIGGFAAGGLIISTVIILVLIRGLHKMIIEAKNAKQGYVSDNEYYDPNNQL